MNFITIIATMLVLQLVHLFTAIKSNDFTN